VCGVTKPTTRCRRRSVNRNGGAGRRFANGNTDLYGHVELGVHVRWLRAAGLLSEMQ